MQPVPEVNGEFLSGEDDDDAWNQEHLVHEWLDSLDEADAKLILDADQFTPDLAWWRYDPECEVGFTLSCTQRMREKGLELKPCGCLIGTVVPKPRCGDLAFRAGCAAMELASHFGCDIVIAHAKARLIRRFPHLSPTDAFC